MTEPPAPTVKPAADGSLRSTTLPPLLASLALFFSVFASPKYSSCSPEESSFLALIGGHLEFSKGFSPRMHFSEAAKLCHTCFDKWTLLTDNQTVSSNISLSDDLLICKNESIKNPWKKMLAPLAQSVRSRYNKSQKIIAA